MKLTIISPTEEKQVSISWMEVNTDIGNFIVQPGHSPIFVILKKDSPFIFKELDDNEEKEIKISSGILNINNKKALLIISPI